MFEKKMSGFVVLMSLVICFVPVKSCFAVGASEKGAKQQLIREYNLQDIPTKDVVLKQGDIKWTKQGLITVSNPKSKQASQVQIATNCKIPEAITGELLRVEWVLVPLKIGGWGQDFRIKDSAIVVEFTGNRPALNGIYKAKDKVEEGKRTVISCDFNKYKVFSWKINGKEQLDKPVDAYRMGQDEVIIQMVDWRQSKSKTLWQKIRLYRIDAHNDLRVRLSSWDKIGRVKKDEPTAFILGQANPMVKVFREAADFHSSLHPIIHISSAKREYESFQVVVIPLGKSLKGVKVKVSDLLHSDGQTRLPRKYIKWFPIGYVRTKPNVNSSIGRLSWQWPDVLMPSKPFDVKVGFVQPIWFTVYVAPNMPAGVYRGLIDVGDNEGNVQTVGLELRVRNYTLPVRGKLKTAFSICAGRWEMWYKPKEVKKRLKADGKKGLNLYTSYECEDVLPHKKWLEFYDFLLAHRLSPTTIYSSLKNGRARVVPPMADMEYCYDRGMNATCLFCTGDDFPKDPKKAQKYLDDLKKYLKQWDNFVKEHNWPDFTFYMHCFDESEMRPNKRKYYDFAMKTVLDFLGKEFPWLKRETANPYIPRHASRIDIFTPLTSQIDKKPKLYAKLIAEGKEIWTYVCCGPGRPYANLLIDFPGVDPRILPWQLYKYHIKGFLYYLINLYWNQENWDKEGSKWPNKPWNTYAYHMNGDGLLVYPGPDATPLASVRLENLRDGIEDYEALAILEELSMRIPKTKNNELLLTKIKHQLAVPDEVTSSWKTYTKDPDVIISARNTTDDLIEQCLLIIQKLKD